MLHRHQSQGRPYPGCTSQRSLLAVMEELSEAVRVLTSALVGDPPMGLPEPIEDEGPAGSDPSGSCSLPLQPEPVHPNAEVALTPEREQEIVAEAMELWDTPWEHLSVAELRALLRTLPIDRRALPAPIENLRRHELVEALLHLPAVCW